MNYKNIDIQYNKSILFNIKIIVNLPDMQLDKLNIIFVSSRFRSGGVEKKINRLIDGLHCLGLKCTLIINEDGKLFIYKSILNSNKVIITNSKKNFISSIKNKLSEEHYNNVIFCFRSTDYSKIINEFNKKAIVYLFNGDYISEKIKPIKKNLIKSLKIKYKLATTWKKANGIITSSPDIAKNWKSLGYVNTNKIYSPTPPIVGDDVLQQSLESPNHSWLNKKKCPVVLGVGRLETSKRFDIFIKALAYANKYQYIRGIIIGQGNEYQNLINLINYYGLQDRIDIPGYVSNPYCWMRNSDILLLTSQVEPLGWVLIESLYVGRPFIASRTPPGPRSIQKETNCGFIVNDDTPKAFAQNINKVLNSHHDANYLHQMASKYDSTSSAREHLEIIKRDMAEHNV